MQFRQVSVVVAVLLLVAFIAFQYQFERSRHLIGVMDENRRVTQRGTFRILEALMDFRVARKDMPGSIDELAASEFQPSTEVATDAVRRVSRWDLDGWGRRLRIDRLSEQRALIRSAGRDGIFDTVDDIVRDVP